MCQNLSAQPGRFSAEGQLYMLSGGMLRKPNDHYSCQAKTRKVKGRPF